MKYHEPCFWRPLPLDDWVAYVQWAMEPDEEDEEEDEDEDEDEEEEDEQGFEIICAVCREKRGV